MMPAYGVRFRRRFFEGGSAAIVRTGGLVLLIAAVWAAGVTAARATALPYHEDAEALLEGPLAGQGTDWTIGAGDPQVAAGLGTSGSQALDTDGDDLSLAFEDSGDPIVWTEFQVTPKIMPPGAQPQPSPDTAAAFFFNSEGDVEVLDGALWRTLDTNLDPSHLHRVSVCNNYAAQTWALWLNGAKVAEDLGFANAVTRYTKLRVRQAARVMDDVRVRRESLVDGYEAWRMSQLWPGPGDDQPLADRDGDCVCNLLEYAFATDPLDPASCCSPCGVMDGEDIAYTFRMNLCSPELGYDLQGSRDLRNWELVIPDGWSASLDPDGVAQWVTYRKRADEEKYYLRLKIFAP